MVFFATSNCDVINGVEAALYPSLNELVNSRLVVFSNNTIFKLALSTKANCLCLKFKRGNAENS